MFDPTDPTQDRSMATLNPLPPSHTVFLGLVSHVLGPASPDLSSIRSTLYDHCSCAKNAYSLRAAQKLHATVFRHLYASGAIHLLAAFKTHCIPPQWQRERGNEDWDRVEHALEHTIDAEQRLHRLRQRKKRRPKNGFLATPARIVRHRHVYRPTQDRVQEDAGVVGSTNSLPSPLSSFATPSPPPQRRTLLVVLRTPRLREWNPTADSAMLTALPLSPMASDPSHEELIPAVVDESAARTKIMVRLVAEVTKSKAKKEKIQKSLAKGNNSQYGRRKKKSATASPCCAIDQEAAILRAAALGLRRR